MAKNGVELICSVAELTGMFSDGVGLDDFLGNVVKTIGRHMQASVCSIYLYDEDSQELVLSATEGLSQSCVGQVRLKLGEGITGTAVKELRPIRESCGSRNPNFKYIPGIEEERFEAFLAVPILLGISRVGALVVQHLTPGYFDHNDSQALRAIASQLASAIENAKLLLSLQGTQDAAPKRRHGHPSAKGQPLFIRGIAGSEGFAKGKAVFFGEFSNSALDERIDSHGAKLERDDFEHALVATERQLDELHAKMSDDMIDISASLIFNAHLLMLRDQMFSGAIREAIKAGTSPPTAVRQVVERFVSLFSNSPNPRLREKVQDVRDLGHRLLLNMLPDNESVTSDYAGCIVVAGELLPTDIIKIVAQNATGLLLTEGSFTAHAAILTRSLGIPLVIVPERQLVGCDDGDTVIVDADQGTVYLNPEPEVVARYRELGRLKRRAATAKSLEQLPATTSDGLPVRLLANINLLSELKIAREFGALGIGLYRSEFPYIVRSNFPTEEEQYHIYKTVLEGMDGRQVVFRTLDVGGDKMLSYFANNPEANPFLGMRAIRLSLSRRDIFEPQIRALLRAAAGREMGIMFPLISSLDEFIEAQAVVRHCSHELVEDGFPHCQTPRLGVMIEVPSAIEIIDELAAASDFLCLGTNDLVQYMLAVDRTNEQVADFYVPHHPAVLRALKKIADAARKADKPLSICGEMAGNRRLLPFLLGIGIATFSIDSRKIPRMRDAIRQLSIDSCRWLAADLLACSQIKDVETCLKEAGNR